jgi:hypothetical protein
LALNYVEGSAIDDGSCQYSLWPGDVDNDCQVTVDDILPIIVYWKLSGPSRSEVSYQWTENVISLEGWLDAFHARSDANGDGIVNVVDIVATVSHIVGTSLLTDNQICAADINADGVINVVDIVAMVSMITG